MLVKNNPPDQSFGNKLLGLIKDKNINPRPRWHFLLQNYLMWLAGLVSLLIGAAAISVMIYLFRYNDWEIYDQTRKSFPEFFVLTLPYFWFIFLGLFIFIISYNFRHTKSGYRYSMIWLAGGSVALSIVLGGIFYTAGLGQSLDRILGSEAPFYDRVINRHIYFWSQPEEGRLAGLVTEESGSSFVLLDSEQDQWQVDTSAARPYKSADVTVGRPIRVLGQMENRGHFKAQYILPLNDGERFFRRMAPSQMHRLMPPMMDFDDRY